MSIFDVFGKLTDAYSDMEEDYYEPGMDDEPLFEAVEDEPKPARRPRAEKKPKKQRQNKQNSQIQPRINTKGGNGRTSRPLLLQSTVNSTCPAASGKNSFYNFCVNKSPALV